MLDITAPAAQGLNLGGINVHTQYRHPRSGKLQTQREAYITKANDCDGIICHKIKSDQTLGRERTIKNRLTRRHL